MSLASTGAPTKADREQGARVPFVPPPLYFGAAFAAGMLLRAATGPLKIGGGLPTAIVGGVGLAAGAVLALTGVATVFRHRTTIVPHHPVRTLLTAGVYRRSRNPMYTGLAIAYVGGALMVGSWWPIITLPIALVLVRILVIDREERYLTERFGQDYLDYRTRTRRWL